MSDVMLIKGLLSAKKAGYGEGTNDSEAFEMLCAEAVLKKRGLSLDEIKAGIVDGQNDAGLDSVYLFINNVLIAEDTDLSNFKRPVEVDLYLIQSKYESGFTETAMAKLTAQVPELLRLDAKPVSLSKKYNDSVCRFFKMYREALNSLTSQFPIIMVHAVYCTIATKNNAKVDEMVDPLIEALSRHHTKANARVETWGAAQLYEESNKQDIFVKALPFVKQQISHGKGYVVLAQLEDYFKFITDADGVMLGSLFEFNVRDYRANAQVNKEIASSLDSAEDGTDFWWLNNGITILSEQAVAQNDELTIRNPLVVNGLQTSHEIHHFFSSQKKDPAKRCVQVRVIEIEDSERRDRVIKATNSQTGLKHSSLHATEPLQRKIEDYLAHHEIYYDRRKDYWRNKGKPADKIIGIDKMAQALLSVYLQRPHEARARPTSILRDDVLYEKIFSERHPLDLYKVCAEFHFRTDAYFRSIKNSVDAIYRNNLRYHVMMQLAWRCNGSRPVHIKPLIKLQPSTLLNTQIALDLNHAIKQFEKLGPEDKTAKDAALTKKIQETSKIQASRLA